MVVNFNSTKEHMKNIDKIYFDADNLIEFLRHDKEHLLFELFGKNGVIHISNYVKSEIYPRNEMSPHYSQAVYLQSKIENYIQNGYIKIAPIPNNSKTETIFRDLVNIHNLGNGEASCIALSTVNNKPMASNNYKDIGMFIKNNLIDNYSSTKILYECVNQNILTFDQACQVWSEFKDSTNKKPAKLPGDTFEDGLFALVRGNEEAIEQVNKVWVKSFNMTSLDSVKKNTAFSPTDNVNTSQLPTFYDHLNNMCESGVISVPVLDYVWQKNLHKFNYQQIEKTYYEHVVKAVQQGEMTIDEVEKLWIPNTQPTRKPINIKYDNVMNDSLKELPTETFKELYEDAVLNNYEIFNSNILNYNADEFLNNTYNETNIIKVVTDNALRLDELSVKKDLKETALELGEALNVDPKAILQNSLELKPPVD